MRSWLLILLLLTTGLAGCIGDGPDDTAELDQAITPVDEQPVSELTVLATQELAVPAHPFEESGAFEPIVDVAPDGTIYVTAHRVGEPNQRHSPLWVSHDGGGSFQSLSWADPETGVSNLPAGIEGDLGIDAAGNVYFVDATNAGTTVTRSTDGGYTWELRNVHTFIVPGGDRPWVEGGAEDTIVVAWTQPPADGLRRMVVAVSSDGGLTFPLQTEVVPCAAFPEAERPVVDHFNPDSQTGDLAVAPDGTIYLSMNCVGHGVEIHRSTDGGATFDAFVVRASSGIPPDFVPSAVDEAGNVYATWPQHSANTSHIYYAASMDDGETWGDPIRVSVHDGASLMPWIEAAEDGHLVVAYYGAPGQPGLPHELDDDASWFPFVTEIRAATTTTPELLHTQMTEAAAAWGPECGTNNTGCPGDVGSNLEDYLGVDLGPDGRVHVAWTTDHEDRGQQVSWGVAEAATESLK